jgi:hypothetical protein
MKIKVDNEELFELNETQKKVIMNDILEEVFEEDMKRRLKYILMHKYERCLERLKAEWLPKIKDRVQSIPTNDDDVARLIFSQQDYESRSMREKK